LETWHPSLNIFLNPKKRRKTIILLSQIKKPLIKPFAKNNSKIEYAKDVFSKVTDSLFIFKPKRN
jgi:hypothetical protein